MKKNISLFLICVLSLSAFVGCGNKNSEILNSNNNTIVEDFVENSELKIEGTKIELSDNKILIDGVEATDDNQKAVHINNDIVYYEDGKDFTYGEGTEKDAHSQDEASKHTVVHINMPGTYILSGTLSSGQIAIDLGDDAKDNPEAIVNLYLNGVNITNTVAPGIIFYEVYEPFNDVTEETAVKDVDTSKAGANVYIVDDSVNNVKGSYVARIYKPESVVLNEDGTKVEESKKLHKYDAAFYSTTTMNINGCDKGNGILNIFAENEGLDSEMHLTINGGDIKIESGNDGINTNEDNISVTTINGGKLDILVNGSTGEGDGIDSNGWLVINGGEVRTQACSSSMDAGIDSDKGIYINGGTVIASGNMLDRIEDGGQTFVVLNFDKFLGAGTYYFKNDDCIIDCMIENNFTSLIISSDKLTEGNYSLSYCNEVLVGSVGESMGMGMPEGFNPNMERPDDMKFPEGDTSKLGNFNEDELDFKINEDGSITLSDGTVITLDEDGQPFFPDGFNPQDENKKPEGKPNGIMENRPNGNFNENNDLELSEIFTIKKGANYFSNIQSSK